MGMNPEGVGCLFLQRIKEFPQIFFYKGALDSAIDREMHPLNQTVPMEIFRMNWYQGSFITMIQAQ